MVVSHSFELKENGNKAYVKYILAPNGGSEITFRYSKWLRVAKALNEQMSTRSLAGKIATNGLKLNPNFCKMATKLKSCYSDLDGDRNWRWHDVRRATAARRKRLIRSWYDALVDVAGNSPTLLNKLFEKAVAAEKAKSH